MFQPHDVASAVRHAVVYTVCLQASGVTAWQRAQLKQPLSLQGVPDPPMPAAPTPPCRLDPVHLRDKLMLGAHAALVCVVPSSQFC